MKLRNKKTGEIKECAVIPIVDGYVNEYEIFEKADSLTELNEEWEDYEEPSGYWYIDFDGDVLSCVEPFDDETEENRKQIGNYFETKEEAEQAVEKLKAWKRLKDKGFGFEGIREDYTKFSDRHLPFRDGMRYLHFNKSEDDEWMKENWDDLDLLFGGEE